MPRRSRPWFFRLLILGSIALAVCAASAAAEEKTAVDYAREIQPLLASRCLKCHGRSKQEGELSLATRDSATRELPSGARAIVPGSATKSELIRRVAHAKADERMPPKGPPLTGEEIEKLRRWIDEGANWPEHWAWRPLARPNVPVVPSTGMEPTPTVSGNPLDQFIWAKLAEKKLTPSPPADKRTLLRRTSFDLLGLPPTAEELAAFEADTSAQAFERVVERLLASPRYGERWARHWMDLAHFAETHGHDQDRIRENAWPYRDFLIRALNADMPYGQFVEQQIAGDVLYPDDPWATIATGFLAAGPWDESSLRDIREDTDDREIARYLDRDDIVTTVMSTFASTTVHCARCHDHKFDPITQAEYYGLQAVFAATDKANRPVDTDRQTVARRAELLARKAQLPELRAGRLPAVLDAKLTGEVATWEKSLTPSASRWQTVELVEWHAAQGSVLVKQDDGSLFAGGGPRPEKDVYTITGRTNLKQVTGVRVEVMTDSRLPHSGPGRQENGNLHLNEFATYSLRSSAPNEAPQKLVLRNPRADFNQQGWSVDLTLDGKPETAWGIYPEVGKPHRAVFELASPLAIAAETQLRFELQQIHGGGHLIGRVRVSVTDQPLPLSTEAETLPTNLAAILAIPAANRAAAQQAELAAYYLEQKIDRELATLPKPQLVYCGTSRFEPDGSFKPSPTPRKVMVLSRGNLITPLGEAKPTAIALQTGLPGGLEASNLADEGARRAALAKWLSDRRNGLVWRSIVNRVWQHHFGRALVDSPSDFGHMGSPPSHAELLDWLAVWLQEHEGSLKALHRLIVTSATYRQASVRASGVGASGAADPRAIDGDNRLLWRANRQRLDAEQLHDGVLLISGQLDPTMGGPSVRQFLLSPGVHVTPNLDYAGYSVDDPGNRRRGVYRFVFRTVPDPFMDALDCPDASQLTPQRTESVTALQALATLHDKFMIRQCEHLAARLTAGNPTPAGQVAAVYREVLLRAPTDAELAAVTAYVQKHGLANACRMLLNTNEFGFVE